MSEGRRVALVTGGGTGIGAACCRELAKAGFEVGIHYNSSEQAARELAAELTGSFLLKADLADVAQADRLCDELGARGGGCAVLVNNAGMTVDAPLFTAKIEDFDRVFASNARSAWYLTKRISRLMIRAKRGHIINISSVVGHSGNVGQSAYAMSKAALDNLTKTAAAELAPYGILVNSVAPGFIRSRMTEALAEDIQHRLLERVPLGRMGEPAEVASLVRFLATEASYCTGAVFHVNGGMYGG